MILYYAMTKFHLLFSITHKLTKHRDEAAILFLYSGMQDVEEHSTRLKETGFFKKIYLVPEIELRKDWKPLHENSREKEIQENVETLAKAVEKWLPVKINKKDDIYIANDHWALGTYCIYHKIPYIYYEDGVGMLSKPEYSYELVKKLNVTHSIVASYLPAFGQNPYAVYKLADLENQSPGFYDERARHFSLKDRLKTLSKEEMEQILYVFGVSSYKIEKKGTLLLTEHFVNMKRLSIEGQKELYALLADFFGEGQIYIKPHPNDFQIQYKEVFPDAELLPRTVPSELLPYCFTDKLELGLAACSTSVFGLKDSLHKTLRFDIDIEKQYQKLFRYFVLAEIVKRAETCGIENCFGLYGRRDMADAFGIVFTPLQEKIVRKNTLIFVDDKEQEEEIEIKADQGSTLIFLSTEAMTETTTGLIAKELAVLRIRKTQLRENAYSSAGDAYVWIYTKNAELKKELKTMEVRRNMKYTGLQLDVEAMTDNKDIQIQMLKGSLTAAQQRLEKAKNTEKQLRREIQELKAQIQNRDREILKRMEHLLYADEKGRVL